MPTLTYLQRATLAARIEKLQDEITDAWRTVSSEEDERRAESMEGELRELQTEADRNNPALAFARWLQADLQVIGEDVDIDRLHRQWSENADAWCNHDPAALDVVEINQCECGAMVPLLPDED